MISFVAAETSSRRPVKKKIYFKRGYITLTLSRRRPLSYRNQSIDLRSKSMDWFLYDNGLRLEKVNVIFFSVAEFETLRLLRHAAMNNNLHQILTVEILERVS